MRHNRNWVPVMVLLAIAMIGSLLPNQSFESMARTWLLALLVSFVLLAPRRR